MEQAEADYIGTSGKDSIKDLRTVVEQVQGINLQLLKFEKQTGDIHGTRAANRLVRRLSENLDLLNDSDDPRWVVKGDIYSWRGEGISIEMIETTTEDGLQAGNIRLAKRVGDIGFKIDLTRVRGVIDEGEEEDDVYYVAYDIVDLIDDGNSQGWDESGETQDLLNYSPLDRDVSPTGNILSRLQAELGGSFANSFMPRALDAFITSNLEPENNVE